MQRKEVGGLEAQMSPNQLLRVCAAQASLPGMRKALDLGADVNYDRGAALMSAVKGTTAIETSVKDKIETIEYLQSRGANLAIRDGYAIDHAVHTDSIPLLSFLLKKIPAAQYDGIAIFVAIHKNNLQMLELLLKHGITLAKDVIDEMSPVQRELLRSTQKRLGLLSSETHSGGESLSSSAAASIVSEASAGSGIAPPPARPGPQTNTEQAGGALAGDKDTASTPAASVYEGAMSVVMKFVADAGNEIMDKLTIVVSLVDQILDELSPSEEDEKQLDLLLDVAYTLGSLPIGAFPSPHRYEDPYDSGAGSGGSSASGSSSSFRSLGMIGALTGGNDTHSASDSEIAQ